MMSCDWCGDDWSGGRLGETTPYYGFIFFLYILKRYTEEHQMTKNCQNMMEVLRESIIVFGNLTLHIIQLLL